MIDHSIRVANLSKRLATFLDMPNDMKEIIYKSSLFHDLGKMKLDQKILNKPTKLTNAEFKYIQKHSVYGYEIAHSLNFNSNEKDNILYHHENYNGTGYPSKLLGEEIPLGARVIRICDVFDALMSKRAYKESMSLEKTLNIMDEEKEKFDPYIYDKFIKMIINGGSQNFF